MGSDVEADRLMRSARVQLGLMMFLQYAIWGAWAPVLSSYMLNDLGFSGSEVGWIYALLPLATIVAPLIGGQVADRWFASEKVIAFLQLGGGVLLLLAARITDFGTLAVVMLVYCLLYAPTLALTNSVAMINMEDSEKEFGAIRVWGTLGWIAAGWMLTGWRWFGESGSLPAMQGDMLFLAGLLSLAMGLQAFLLPHTPPQKEGVSPWAFLESFKMLKVRDFAVFVGITFVVATELEFYYILTAPFLESEAIGVSSRNIPAVMTIAQFAEIFVMAFLLSWSLKRYGMRRTLAIGVVAWPIRYIIFAIGSPAWLVIASLALHGFCYVFFFVAAFIYVDKVAPPDIRASAQSLIAIIALGFGRFLGSLFAGWVRDLFTTEAGTNWTYVFLVPCALTIFCAVAFLLFFREESKPIATATA
ncbi:MAG: MFS transporter [marine benthic group bacterium]|nr:MFS transporter [Gemmatimonadota bacterium]MCL7961338.1 MFS transporter [Candidatus Carthagonibacter metallireducens]MCL7957262.1 MFS transporter [Gemmatimonadota bacterium]MCL7965936.1 MFS transporter [Gemmatimonadota bacterium]MCL7974804.1 MFS transporter [Gemmatimonadota bacterium]